MGLFVIIVVMAVAALVARNVIVAKSARGGKSRERAEREGDLGEPGRHRAEQRRRMR